MNRKYNLALVVDDHDISNFVAQNILINSGVFAHTLIEPSGFSALAYIEQKIDSPEDLPDLILLDISMPGVDGISFLEKFRELPRNVTGKVKIVVLSGNEQEKRLDRWLHDGTVTSFVAKPLTKIKLENLLKKLR